MPKELETETEKLNVVRVAYVLRGIKELIKNWKDN